MKVEIRVLTQDGGSYTTAAGLAGQIAPNTPIVLEDLTSITLNAPGGETPGEGSTAPSQ